MKKQTLRTILSLFVLGLTIPLTFISQKVKAASALSSEKLGTEYSVVITTDNLTSAGSDVYTAKTNIGNSKTFQMSGVTISNGEFKVTSAQDFYIKNKTSLESIYRIEVLKDLDHTYLYRDFELTYDCSEEIDVTASREITRTVSGFYNFTVGSTDEINPKYFALKYKGQTDVSFKAIVISYLCDANAHAHSYVSKTRTAHMYEDTCSYEYCTSCGKVRNYTSTADTSPWEKWDIIGSTPTKKGNATYDTSTGYMTLNQVASKDYVWFGRNQTPTGFSRGLNQLCITMSITKGPNATWGPDIYLDVYQKYSILTTQSATFTARFCLSYPWTDSNGDLTKSLSTYCKFYDIYGNETNLCYTLNTKFVLVIDLSSFSSFNGGFKLSSDAASTCVTIHDITMKKQVICDHSDISVITDKNLDRYEICNGCGKQTLIERNLAMTQVFCDEALNEIHYGTTAPDGTKGTTMIKNGDYGVWDCRTGFETALSQARNLEFNQVSWKFYVKNDGTSTDATLALYTGEQHYFKTVANVGNYSTFRTNNKHEYMKHVLLNNYAMNSPKALLKTDAWNEIIFDMSDGSPWKTDSSARITFYNTTKNSIYYQDCKISRDKTFDIFETTDCTYVADNMNIENNVAAPDGTTGNTMYLGNGNQANMWYERYAYEGIFAKTRSQGLSKFHVEFYVQNSDTSASTSILMYMGAYQYSIGTTNKLTVWQSTVYTNPDDGIGYSGDIHYANYMKLNGVIMSASNAYILANAWNSIEVDLSNVNCPIGNDSNSADRISFWSKTLPIYVQNAVMYK